MTGVQTCALPIWFNEKPHPLSRAENKLDAAGLVSASLAGKGAQHARIPAVGTYGPAGGSWSVTGCHQK